MQKHQFAAVVAATVGVVMLSACGGGGGSSSSMMSDLDAQRPTASAAATVQASGVTAAANRAASSLPLFGSVSQSASRDGVSGISTDRVSTTFDGDDFTLSVRRQRGNDAHLSSAEDHTDGYLYDYTPIPGHDRGADGFIVDYRPSETTAAYVAVSWLNSDPTDYLAGGYWLHISGDVLGSGAIADDAGAFIDGPEISLASRPTMPVQGSATYRGDAAGLYGATYGSDVPQYQGETEIGEWAGDLRLMADFASRTIGGDVDSITVDGYASDYRIGLGAVSFDSRGTFRGSTVRLEHPQLAFTRNTGNWGGMFSNRLDSTGDPRLVAGTLGGEAETTGGSTATFVGAWYGTK